MAPAAPPLSIRIAGAGGHVPHHVVTNERMVKAVPGWTPDRIEAKTGIRERRHLWPIDVETGCVCPPEPSTEGPNVQLAEAALREALTNAGLQASELDGLILSTCTPDMPNFSHDALILHRRLGMRSDAFAMMHDDGCGGAMFHMAGALERMRGGERRTIAIVASTAFSPHLDRAAYSGKLRQGGKELGSFLSWYLFGDGAGAIILRAEPTETGSGFLGSYAANEYMDLVVRRGGGTQFPFYPGRGDVTDNAFYVDGQLVAETFGPVLKRAIDGALERAGCSLSDISRFYLHQANKRLLEAFIREHNIPSERVPMHMERYSNIVAASTLVLLAEDLRDGVVKLGSGEPIIMAALGAGAQCGAHVIRL